MTLARTLEISISTSHNCHCHVSSSASFRDSLYSQERCKPSLKIYEYTGLITKNSGVYFGRKTGQILTCWSLRSCTISHNYRHINGSNSVCYQWSLQKHLTDNTPGMPVWGLKTLESRGKVGQLSPTPSYVLNPQKTHPQTQLPPCQVTILVSQILKLLENYSFFSIMTPQ